MTIVFSPVCTCSMSFLRISPGQNMGIASNFFRFSRFGKFEVFKHNIRHTYIFAKNGMITIPQENSYMGMAVSRGKLCCNIQDLLLFSGFGCARGFQKIANMCRPL